MIRQARPQTPLLQECFHRTLLPDASPWLEQYRTASGYLLRFPGLADFSVSTDGCDIASFPVHGISPATLEHLYLNQVLPLALSRQRRVVLHASAVQLGNAAIAFVGESGRGKSTLATAFARADHPFLTDDGLQVLSDAAGWAVLPGPASLRLWDDASEALLLADAPVAVPVDYSDKQRLLATDSLPHSTRCLPLQSLYLLGEGQAERVTITEVAPSAGLMALVRHCFLLDIGEEEMLRWHFPQLADIARKLPMFTLDYPRDFALLPAVMQAVMEQTNLMRANA